MADDAIRRAVVQLRRLPGIGDKTATRLVYWLLRAKRGTAGEIAQALSLLEEGVRECSVCCNLGSSDPCAICGSPNRDPSIVCVVEEPVDVLAFERAGEFRGRYHVLHGALSPLDGIAPDALRIRQLVHRLNDGEVKEIILATNPTIEGDATALYLGRLLVPLGVKVTRLAHGLSVGTEIEYADAASIGRALHNRREM